jgi:Mn2+/Fe2+ NRAMP family transporter
MIADVDAASVITAAENGALYGTELIWLLIALTLPLFVIQEVAGRVGTVTGKGLGQLIRENFAPRVAALSALPMIGADVIIFTLEYAGIALGLEIFGVPPYISVPATFALNVLLVYRRRLAEIEKPLIAISFVLAVSYGVSAYYVTSSGIKFTPFYFATSPTFLFLIAANIGSTIVPFMLFYQSSASAEKGIGSKNLWAMRLETAVGAIISEAILIAVEIAAVGVGAGSSNLAPPQVLSRALSTVSGSLSPYLFGVGLISAGFVALIVVSLGSAWGVTSAMGWGKKNLFRVYLLESIPALVISLLPFNLVSLALSLLALQVVLLIIPVVLLGMIASKKGLMGGHSLRGPNKVLYWSLLLLVIATGVVSLVAQAI